MIIIDQYQLAELKIVEGVNITEFEVLNDSVKILQPSNTRYK